MRKDIDLSQYGRMTDTLFSSDASGGFIGKLPLSPLTQFTEENGHLVFRPQTTGVRLSTRVITEAQDIFRKSPEYATNSYLQLYMDEKELVGYDLFLGCALDNFSEQQLTVWLKNYPMAKGVATSQLIKSSMPTFQVSSRCGMFLRSQNSKLFVVDEEGFFGVSDKFPQKASFCADEGREFIGNDVYSLVTEGQHLSFECSILDFPFSVPERSIGLRSHRAKSEFHVKLRIGVEFDESTIEQADEIVEHAAESDIHSLDYFRQFWQPYAYIQQSNGSKVIDL